MEIFHMWDVLPLLGIDLPPSGRSSLNVSCPCCDDSPRKKHLNINLKKEVFRCPRCGISGGIFDLYSLYTNVPREKVRKALVERLGIPEGAKPKQKKNFELQAKEECPITDIELRHATYSALLSKLSLAADHRDNLLNRGLTDDDIKRLGYKSTPVVGMSALAKQLRSEGYYVLSDSLFVVWRNGSYRVREYSIDGTTMIYQYNTYHKDGADSSASTLESLASAVVGTWRDDSYYEYYIYANGTYQRYFNLYSSRGELELHNLEEQGTYEILDHEKIRLWVNGERVMYDDFIYNPQDDTLYMKYSDRTFVRCS